MNMDDEEENINEILGTSEQDENINNDDDAVDRAALMTDNEVFFDIEKKSEGERTLAFKHLVIMYKWHFLLLLFASFVSAGILFASFIMRGSLIGWQTEMREIALKASNIPIGIAILLLVVLLEKLVYEKDDWTMKRLGFVHPTSREAFKSYLYGLIPLVFIIPGFFYQSGPSPATIWFIVIGTVPIIILEEIIFRGVYWKYTVMKYGQNNNIILYLLNGLMFALIHVPSLFINYVDGIISGILYVQIPAMGIKLSYMFILGITLAILRDALNNIYAPIIYHLTNNIITLLLPVGNIGTIWKIIISCIVLGALMVLNLLKIIRSKRDVPDEIIPRSYNQKAIDTKFHWTLKRVYLVGGALIILYYAFGMTILSIPALIISLITMIVIVLIFSV